MTAKELLIAAKQLIATPDSWTKYYPATTSTGACISPHSPDATCFCSYGALDKAAGPGDDNHIVYREALSALQELAPNGHVAIFNDHPNTTHDMVLDLFDKAIASCP